MRIPRALALFMLAFVAVPSAASAQTPTQGGITIVLQSVSVNGTVVRDTTDDDILVRGYNEDECAAPSTVTSVFRVSNVPAGITFLDAWIGDSTVDCSTTTARQTGDQRQCTHLVGSDPDIDLDSEITLTLEEMLDPDDSACDVSTAAGRTQLLWLFALGSQETTAAVTNAQYGYVSFTVDPKAPTTPAPNDTMVSGDETITVGWGVGSEQNLRYNVYVDTSVGACTDTGMWMAGDPPPGDPTREELTTNSVGLSATSTGLAIGQSALVYVTALDRSDNESNLSTAVCITRVETVGFCDALAAGGEECTNTCAATLPGTRSASGALLLGLAGLALVVRRRTRS